LISVREMEKTTVEQAARTGGGVVVTTFALRRGFRCCKRRADRRVSTRLNTLRLSSALYARNMIA
jgi:hypothetical protein